MSRAQISISLCPNPKTVCVWCLACKTVHKAFSTFQFARAISENPEESKFYALFKNIDAEKFGMNCSEVSSLQEEAKRLISEEVTPAFERLLKYIKEEYSEHHRFGLAVSNVKDGRYFYQKCLEYHTSIRGIKPEDVHNIGLEEVEKLRGGVMEIARLVVGLQFLYERKPRPRNGQSCCFIVVVPVC